ncbi:Hsp20/alpha crystallin family protein [Fusibacter tunisiensis]|uniref:HSP20 family protein n=1 Tax=Fusibacter tunisiensis TaxID=1008308 RepID=A0ABS2MST4_9FIRM|nr:Hsp20/alpha crystallin family protein [Fusibacter tunisiensis]MBM7562405.1 HSP20 family protein [Fusibacter tunisiensis]
MLKINPEKFSSKHRQALDQLFYDVMEEKVSCAVKKGDHVINTFDVDVRENDYGFLVEAELPGISIEEISIVYEDNFLSIIAKRAEESDLDAYGFIRRERRYGTFRRNFLVEDVDVQGIKATLKNGVLKVSLPKISKDLY